MGKLPFSIRTRASALLSSLLLAACASTPIEEAPVSDRSAAPGSGTAGPASGQSAVAPVAAGRPGADASGPLGAARVVYFDYDSSAIRPEFQSVIDTHARFLGSHQARKIMIGGHTDERGGREYNLALGQQRAEAVRRALQLLGARASQIETISFGEEKPEAAGHEEAAWSRNRRAELSYR
jgi:peptidoglycan-associated lipoprotein